MDSSASNASLNGSPIVAVPTAEFGSSVRLPKLKHKHTDVLHVPAFNKGTGFTEQERDYLGLRGLLPPRVESLDEQLTRMRAQFQSFETPLQKYVYLERLHATNENLYYHFLLNNLEVSMPIVYTPTVGEACLKFSAIYRSPFGMFLTAADKGNIRRILDNWPAPEVDIIVVSDGSRILGLGDLGCNGMGIPIGKLALYVAAGGFHPARSMPVLFDVGTNNESNLNDPFYLGVRSKRVPSDQFYALFDEFMAAVTEKWPRILVQFEDFSNDHCFELLERNRKKYLCFNDDIQGTGSVILSGFITACRRTGIPAPNHRIVVYGAGSAAVGVADEIVALMTESGISAEEARKRFWLVDSHGLVTTNRGDELQAHKKPYARQDNTKQIKDLHEVIKEVKPTALIGLAGSGPAFTAPILKEMANLNENPIIFALSNPTSKSECTAIDAYTHTDGRALFASGSPFPPVDLNGKHYIPGQGNNMYIFPGLGFGASLAHSKIVTNEMILKAAKTLSSCVTPEEEAAGRLYPDLKRIREISAKIAVGVIETAQAQGIAQNKNLPADLLSYVKSRMYVPSYNYAI